MNDSGSIPTIQLWRIGFAVALVFVLASVLSAQTPGSAVGCPQGAEKLRQGRELHLQKKYSLAIKEFQAAQALCPGSPAPALEIVQSYLAARAFHNAEITAKALLDVHPDSELGQFFLAYSYFMRSKFGESARVLQKLIRQDDNYEDALRLAGMTQYFLHDYAKAILLFQAALRLRPGDGEALLFLGASYYIQMDSRQALKIFQQLLLLFPDSYQAYDHLGLCYEASGKMDAALRAYARSRQLARKRAPGYSLASANLAELLIRMDRPNEALPFAAEAVQTTPGAARNQYLLAKALTSSPEPDSQEILLHLKEAIRLNPKYPEAHYLLGRTYYGLGRKDEATQEFAAFQALQAEVAWARRGMGNVSGMAAGSGIEKLEDH
jgi:tetratricopeptide (TPR) repeat protein